LVSVFCFGKEGGGWRPAHPKNPTPCAREPLPDLAPCPNQPNMPRKNSLILPLRPSSDQTFKTPPPQNRPAPPSPPKKPPPGSYGLDLLLLSIDEGISGYRDDSLATVKRNEKTYGGGRIVLPCSKRMGAGTPKLHSQRRPAMFKAQKLPKRAPARQKDGTQARSSNLPTPKTRQTPQKTCKPSNSINLQFTTTLQHKGIDAAPQTCIAPNPNKPNKPQQTPTNPDKLQQTHQTPTKPPPKPPRPKRHPPDRPLLPPTNKTSTKKASP
jgi:hypothetical protein